VLLPLLVAYFAFAMCDSASAADEVILFESFEKGESQPADWSKGAPIPTVRYLWPKQASDGERSLSLKKSANRYFPVAEWSREVPLEKIPSSLAAKVQVKAQRAGKATVDAQFLDANGEFLSHGWLAYIGAENAGDPPANHPWKEYTGTVAVPPNAKTLVIALQIYGPGQVWFDELELRAAGSSGDANSTEEPAAAAGKPASEAPADAVSVDVTNGAKGDYLLAVPANNVQPPAGGFALVVALPGGDGSADFHPFVSNIRQQALGDGFLIAQPLAKKWTPEQQVVWPTAKLPVTDAKFTTEQLVSAVIDDVAAKHKINRQRVYLLAWSSGGPAAYATLLQEKSPAVGGLIAMSVFQPAWLPPLSQAKARRFYIFHSPSDQFCPHWMAKTAEKSLAEAGAKTTLADYEGGHGWHGDIFGNIRRGIEWLERPQD